MKTITLLTLAIGLSSCSFRITPDGGKEVKVDARSLLAALLDAKNSRSVQP
jgi:hypothetical protein